MNTIWEPWNKFEAELPNVKSVPGVDTADASTKDQHKVCSNFRPLLANPIFDGVNISIPCKVVEKVSSRFEHTLYGYFIGKRIAFPVVKYYARNNWAKHGLKRIMMNNKGFFFFKFDSRFGLEAILEGGPWLILFKEDGISLIATFIGKPVMLDSYTSSMCNDSCGQSSFDQCLIEVNSEADLVDVVTVVSPPIVTTSNVVAPTVVKTNDGFQMVSTKKKKKGKSKASNGGQFPGPSIKQNVRYEPKATTSAPKKGATNVEEDDEVVENVYDETTNIFTNSQTGGSSSFMVAAG
ncbi:zinc knuckle CX2CX4HX4C containing protein [Tanacetum coccineum]